MSLESTMLRMRYDCGFKTIEPRAIILPPKYEPPSFVEAFDEWWGAALARHNQMLVDNASVGEVLGWAEWVLHRH